MVRSSLITGILVVLGLIGSSASAQVVPKAKTTKVLQVKKTSIAPSVQYRFDPRVGAGRIRKGSPGKPGQVKQFFSVVKRGGKVLSRNLVKTHRQEPVAATYLIGTAGYQPSRRNSISRSGSVFARHRVLDMKASAYDPSPRTIGRGATGLTRMGLRATFGHVAVDPRVIPLGTLVFVEGYGFAIASDTGGDIKGNRIDLCFDDRATAIQFGRRTVRVHILGKAPR